MTAPIPDHESHLPEPASTLFPHNIFLAHLPLCTDEVFGRETEFQRLDAAWNTGQPNILTLVALPGLGKTALVSSWLWKMLRQPDSGVERVLGWSFLPSAGQEASSDEFLAYALNACGDPNPTAGLPWKKGRRLAKLLQAQRTLLVLENIQALQYADGDMQGRLKDQGLKALLYAVARLNPGLCLLTTSLPVKDLEQRFESHGEKIPIPNLSPEAGTQLLRAGGVKGPVDAVKNVVRDFDGHPLALRLLSGYLTFTHRGDIRKIDLNSPLSKVNRPDKHVRRVVDGFTIWLQRKPELNILFLLGICDCLIEDNALNAPYHCPVLAALLQAPAIKGLTTYVYECPEADWQAAVERLLNLYLLTEKIVISDTSPRLNDDDDAPAQCRAADCHGLVREYFTTQFRTRLPGSWREAQNRLYEHAVQGAEQISADTLEALHPQFDAVRYGCALGLHEHTFQLVYWNRIHRGDENYCAGTLGAPGADLVALSHFFAPNEAGSVEHVPDAILVRLLEITARRLRNLGRLYEAAEFVKKGMVAWNAQEHWENTAERAKALSRLLLPAGEVEQAVVHARLALQLYDAGEDMFNSAWMHVRLIRALHVSGDLQEAEEVCRELEVLQAEQKSQSDLLKTPCADFACCDLLLHLGQHQAVRKMACAALEENDRQREPLQKAAAQLLSAKILLFQAIPSLAGQIKQPLPAELETAPEGVPEQVNVLLDRAIETFRDVGSIEWLIQGLFTRSIVGRVMGDFSTASADLEELRELTELGGMPLYLTDYHLESARVVYAQCAGEDGKFSSDAAGEEFHQRMHDHVEVAEALIWRTGYHLRDAELEQLMTLLKDAIPERVEDADIAGHQQEVSWLVPPPRKVSRPARQRVKIPPPPVQQAQQQPKVQRKKAQEPKILRPAPHKPAIVRPIQPEPAAPPPIVVPAGQDQEVKWVERQERRLRQIEGYDNVYLYPGELYIAESPTIVWTLLGSCIAVVLYNKQRRMGAICHAQLPEERFRDKACSLRCDHPCYTDAPDPARFKYATCSIRFMYDRFMAQGMQRDDITVKLFGGASVLEGVRDTINVGEENVKVARKVLQEYKLKIVRKDVGGRRGRTLYFYSDTGEVFMKKHRSNEER